MELDIVYLLANYHWQIVVIALGTMVLIGLNKLWLRKVVVNENARHGIYTLMNFAFAILLAIGVYYFSNSFTFDWTNIWQLSITGYALLNIIYPLYANLSIKDLLIKIFSGLGKVIGKAFGEVRTPKQLTDKEKEKQAEDAAKKVIEL